MGFVGQEVHPVKCVLLGGPDVIYREERWIIEIVHRL